MKKEKKAVNYHLKAASRKRQGVENVLIVNLPLLSRHFSVVVDSRDLVLMEKVIHGTTGIQSITKHHHFVSLCQARLKDLPPRKNEIKVRHPCVLIPTLRHLLNTLFHIWCNELDVSNTMVFEVLAARSELIKVTRQMITRKAHLHQKGNFSCSTQLFNLERPFGIR